METLRRSRLPQHYAIRRLEAGYLQLDPINLHQSSVQPGETSSINTEILLVQKSDSLFAPRGLPNCFPELQHHSHLQTPGRKQLIVSLQ